MDCLKNEYKWELHFPETINDFKFNKEMMKQIFDSGFCSRTLNEDSKHHLILKSYMNCFFDEQVITSKTDKSHHVKFNINKKFKKIYILIKDSVYIPTDVCNEPIPTQLSKELKSEMKEVKNYSDDEEEVENYWDDEEDFEPIQKSELDYGLP